MRHISKACCVILAMTLLATSMAQAATSEKSAKNTYYDLDLSKLSPNIPMNTALLLPDGENYQLIYINTQVKNPSSTGNATIKGQKLTLNGSKPAWRANIPQADMKKYLEEDDSVIIDSINMGKNKIHPSDEDPVKFASLADVDLKGVIDDRIDRGEIVTIKEINPAQDIMTTTDGRIFHLAQEAADILASLLGMDELKKSTNVNKKMLIRYFDNDIDEQLVAVDFEPPYLIKKTR